MKQWSQSELFEIHLELSSSCQASCPACSRVHDYNEAIPNGKIANAWSVNSLHQVFNKKVLAQVREFLLCGNYGDPLAFADIGQWIADVLLINPSISFWIHTNGGLGTTKTWQTLGSLLKHSASNVHFSIDGLADTNHIYRRGVEWQKVIANAQTFIDAGGRATWKFIEFPHNAHQVKEANELANCMGFKKFKVIKPYSDEGNIESIPMAKDLPKDEQKSFEDLSDLHLQEINFSSLNVKKDIGISCEAINENSLYVDCDKKLWPCCWMARTADHRLRLTQREEFYRKVYDQYGISSGFNSLVGKDLFSLLIDPFFKDYLPKSWQKKTIEEKQCLSICLEKCSKAHSTQE